MGTSGSASSGFYFIDQGGFMASAASTASAGVMQRVSDVTKAFTGPPVLISEAPLLPNAAAAPVAATGTGSGSGTGTSTGTSGSTGSGRNHAHQWIGKHQHLRTGEFHPHSRAHCPGREPSPC